MVKVVIDIIWRFPVRQVPQGAEIQLAAVQQPLGADIGWYGGFHSHGGTPKMEDL